MASISPSPFSLRPWPTGDKKPKKLGEFIARVNAERGGFRNVTEMELREELHAKEDGRNQSAASSPDSDSDMEVDSDGAKSKTTLEAREEFLRNIEFAHQSAMLSLDFVSLLLSKETPNQANTTLSPALRDLVGFGVLGASRLQDSNITPARTQDDLAVATGWRLIGTSKMVDSVLEAAERLEKEISLETKYWADVLAVSDNGWTVTSLPYESHTLGVRYGFAESAPEYRNSSIAPLRRNDDGTVRLERGASSGASKRVRAVVTKNGQVTGKSRLPGQVNEKAPLQDRVLEARNTIFSQELWYELNKEARTLLSLKVQSNDDQIVYEVDSETKVILTLDDLDAPDAGGDLPDNQFANTVVLGLHFLLLFSHRLSYFKRTQSTQTTNGREAPPLSILRPLISRLTYDNACTKLTYFLTKLKTILHDAGFSTADFSQIMVPPGPQLMPQQIAQLALQQIWRASPSEALIINLAQLLELTAELTFTPQARVVLRGRSFVTPMASTQFMLFLPGASNANPATKSEVPAPAQTKSNELEELYPPYSQDAYPNVDEAIYYIRQASVRVIVDWVANLAAEKLGRDDLDWSETTSGAVIRGATGKNEVRLDIVDSPDLALRLQMRWVENREVKQRSVVWAAGHENNETLEQLVVDFLRQ